MYITYDTGGKLKCINVDRIFEVTCESAYEVESVSITASSFEIPVYQGPLATQLFQEVIYLLENGADKLNIIDLVRTLKQNEVKEG